MTTNDERDPTFLALNEDCLLVMVGFPLDLFSHQDLRLQCPWEQQMPEALIGLLRFNCVAAHLDWKKIDSE